MLDPLECEEREWLIPTGTGGYSSSTPCGINARTYHGLLVVPQDPPHRRFMTLSKVEDSLLVDGHEYPMSTNRYQGDVFHPQGYRYLERFVAGENFVTWEYSFDKVRVEKTLVVNRGNDSIILRYRSGGGVVRVCPLVTFRSHHLVIKERHPIFSYSRDGGGFTLTVGNRAFLRLDVEEGFQVEDTGYWYYNFVYRLDRERGSNYLEDLYNPFCLISVGNKLTLHAYWGERGEEVELKPYSQELLTLLSNASKSFVVKGREGYALIAGYHWFDEWGRDTMISLEGALLMNGSQKQASQILSRYFERVNRGMMPNNFLGNEEVMYKGVDVSLWGVNALFKYYLYTKDLDLVRKLFPKVLEVLDEYWKGNGVVFNRGGLLYHSGSPRTWMDAQFDGNVVTPREGATVEVNALWYNALMIAWRLGEVIGYDAEEFQEKAKTVKSAFRERFVFEGGLYDYVDWDGRPNRAVRPNQIFAISLPFPVVEGELAKRVLRVVEERLVRPYGLSTLAQGEQGYTPFYRGDRRSRDMAYHNGPIWPWLVGAYADAKVRFEEDPIEVKRLLNVFRPLLNLAEREGGYIPELFEDIPPYRKGGCIAQAWSVAEVLRGVSNVINLS